VWSLVSGRDAIILRDVTEVLYRGRTETLPDFQPNISVGTRVREGLDIACLEASRGETRGTFSTMWPYPGPPISTMVDLSLGHWATAGEGPSERSPPSVRLAVERQRPTASLLVWCQPAPTGPLSRVVNIPSHCHKSGLLVASSPCRAHIGQLSPLALLLRRGPASAPRLSHDEESRAESALSRADQALPGDNHATC
jgi:hypothetical protein